MHPLLSPDPQDGGSPTADPPPSVKIVKKTQGIKSPREIQLEKKLSELEDKVDGLFGWQQEVNTLMADSGLGGKVAPARKPRDKNSIFDELEAFFGSKD